MQYVVFSTLSEQELTAWKWRNGCSGKFLLSEVVSVKSVAIQVIKLIKNIRFLAEAT